MDKPPVAKLQVKPGMRVLVLHPPQGYPADLGDMPPDVSVETTPAEEPYDGVLAFMRDRAGLEAVREDLIRSIRPGGLLWISYPKGGGTIRSDLNRDSLVALMQPTGWRPVTQIAVDATWSALRFRPLEDVASR